MDETKPPNLTLNPAQTEPLQNSGAFPQLSSHDGLNSDRVGEELNHDASIWRLYAMEAKDYDTAFRDERNDNLNNMLLFAGLFSAIVTAFLIESTNLLEPDSTEVGNQLLLKLLQSQERVERGTPNLTLLPTEIPRFTPPATARLINILWFASLMIALGASVVAILAKEWLSAFTSYRTRHAYEYALERHTRLASLETWNMRPIIDLLPTLLNIALLIFTLGLIIRLWLLDSVVAGVITIISTVVCAIYLFFVISGARQKDCPYKARLSTYFSKSKPIAPHTQTRTTSSEEIDLLTWLLKKSSDPTMTNFVTQALAGLRSLPLWLPTFLDSEKSIQELHDSCTQNREDLASLFEMGVHAIGQLQMAPTRGRNELVSTRGSNAARLSVAISEIYPYALTWQEYGPEDMIPRGGGRGQKSTFTETWGCTWFTFKLAPQNSDLITNYARTIIGNAFDTMDLLWAETSPALALTSYAYLLTAEVKMLRHAIAFETTRARTKPSSVDHLTIDTAIPKASGLGHAGLSLHERYSRTLSRTALVIKSSLDYLTSKGNQNVQFAISGLLLEVTDLVKAHKPKPAGRRLIRRLFERTSRPSYREVSITVATENNTTEHVSCKREEQNFELVESLVELCGCDYNTNTLCLEGFQAAALNLLVAFWPAYLEQSRSRIVYPGLSEIRSWELREWYTVPFQHTPYNSQASAKIMIYQSIALTTVAISLHDLISLDLEGEADSGKGNILRRILQLLLSRSSMTALSRATENLKDNDKDDNILARSTYCEWLPTNAILASYITTIEEWRSARWASKETLSELSWCISLLMTMTQVLDEFGGNTELHCAQGSGHLQRARPTIQSTNVTCTAIPSTPKSTPTIPSTPNSTPRLELSKILDLMYSALQATDRDVTSPMISSLLSLVTSYIETTDCHECLSSFTLGRGFHVLSEIGRVESDSQPVARAVCSVMDALYAADLVVGEEALPSLLKAMRLVCDSIARPNDPESFFDCALFHLQRLPKITPETPLLVRNLLEQLHQWANSSQDLYNSAQTLSIVAMWNQFQRRDRFSSSNNITSIEEEEEGGELLKDEPEQNWLIPNIDDFGHI